MWISCFFLTVPIGLIVGYGSTAVFFSGEDNWKWAFLIQTALMIVPISVLMIFFPAKYYEKPKSDANISQTQGLIEATHHSIDGLKKTISEHRHVKMSHKTFSIIEKQPLPIWTIIKNLLLNPSYILSVLAITNVMFILTAL